ncbi:MAG: hypothetical protein KIT57_10735 [Blastocatellales bacterium]|nr:hypothetical protein [Blastocatellales bacterium]
MRDKILFYCQHVLGMGHFIRSAALARALARRFDVHFINGGEIIPGFELPPSIDLIQLPAIRTDEGFRELIAVDDGRTIDEIREIRKRMLTDAFERVRPDILAIEMFPFGRRKFAFELIPLLDCARSNAGRTKVVCSVRDILVAKRDPESFEAEVCRIVNRYFDLVLVHADPNLQCLDETFHSTGALTVPVRYTGFIAPDTSSDTSSDTLSDTVNESPESSGEEKLIVVSLGGGRVGAELIDCAIDASGLLAAPHRLLIFTGPYFPASGFERVQQRAAGDPRITIRKYTTRFAQHIAAADLSLSMAGYNTCLNIIAAGVCAIVYPFADAGESEQPLRAEKLRRLGLVDVIRPGELEPEHLAAMITKLLELPRPEANAAALDLGGADHTAELIAELSR